MRTKKEAIKENIEEARRMLPLQKRTFHSQQKEIFQIKVEIRGLQKRLRELEEEQIKAEVAQERR